MSNIGDRLQLFEQILSLIERKRAETNDELLGASIERVVLDTQVQELEQETLENPGGTWLVRRRRRFEA
jgi:hypothetical protein